MFICKRSSYFHMFLFFLVFDKNKCYHFILCVIFFSVCYSKLFLICHFCEFGLLKNTRQWNLPNNYHTNWFRLGAAFMYVNIYNMLWGNDFSYNNFLILTILSNKDSRCVLKIWLFWTSVIGSLIVLNGHNWNFCMRICQCAL